MEFQELLHRYVLFVQCADLVRGNDLEKELCERWNAFRGRIEELEAKNRILEDQVRSLQFFQESVSWALNSGNGTYKP